MKSLFMLAGLVIIGVAVGIVHIQKNNDQVNITIDKTRLEQTTEQALQEGRHLIDQAEQSLERANAGSAKSAQLPQYLPESTRQ